MTNGFRARERCLDVLRADHRPADEPRLRPPGRRGAGPARGRDREESASWSRRAARSSTASTGCCAASRSGSTGSRTSAGSASRAAWRSASPARCCAPPACPGTCARPSPTWATRPTTSTCRPTTAATAGRASWSGSPRCASRCKIIEQVLDRLEPGPAMVDDPKIAWPAKLSLGPDGMGNSLEHVQKIMGTSMESLIHHFKLVTEGFRVPAGQVYTPVESPARRARRARRQRRRHPAVPRALPRAVASSTCRPTAALSIGGLVADVIAVGRLDRPRDGWV